MQTTPKPRVAWLEAEMARADLLSEILRGAYGQHAHAGAAIVCSFAVQIDAWYGVGDTRPVLTRVELEDPAVMPLSRSSNLREELARFGIHDCVLDMNR